MNSQWSYLTSFYRETDAPKPSAPSTPIHLQLETSFDPEETDVVIEQAELRDLRSIPEDQRPAMMDAIIKEINGPISLGTFTLEPIPKGHRPIDSKLVLKIKYRADGSYDKHKARLVARGFQARLGVDFSPMASLTAVRVMCSLALSLGFH